MSSGHPTRLIALAVAAAFAAVVLGETSRVPAGGALAQGDPPLPTAIGAYWPEVAVTGVVLGAPRGTPGPVPGAWVIVYTRAGKCEASTRTDVSGGFGRRCRDVSKAGVVELHALAPGHAARIVRQVPSSVVADDTSAGPGELSVIIELTPETPAPDPSPTIADALTYVTLAGTVVDGGRAEAPPVTGARVVAVGEQGGAYRCLSPVVTAADGRFEMVCPYGNFLVPFRLRILADGFAPADATGSLGGRPMRIELQRAVPAATPAPGQAATPTDDGDRAPRITVSGVVRGADEGERPPIIGARVFVYGWPGQCQLSTWTAPNGYFELTCTDLNWHGSLRVDVVPPHDLVAPNGRGYGHWAASVAHGQPGAWGDALRLEIVLQPDTAPTPPMDRLENARFFGRVLDGRTASQAPVAGARVDFAPARCLSPVRTDGDGRWEVLCPWALAHESASVTIAAPGRRLYVDERENIASWLFQPWDIVLPADETPTPATASPTETPPVPPAILPWAGRPS